MPHSDGTSLGFGFRTGLAGGKVFRYSKKRRFVHAGCILPPPRLGLSENIPMAHDPR